MRLNCMALSGGMTTLLSASALALSVATLATPATAGEVCETTAGAGGSAPGTLAVACGLLSEATGVESTAIGSSSTASASGAVALGRRTTASGANSTAIGTGATASHVNSIAIGVNVATDRDGQIKIGTADHTYTLAGVNSDASKAAQAGTTYLLTSDADGNLATSTFDLATLENLPDRMDQAEQDIGALQTTAAEHGTRITNVETKNVEQDGRLDTHEGRLNSHEGRITQTEAKNVEQDGRIDQHAETLNTHTFQIADLDSRTFANTTAINALDGRVTNLENRMDEGFGRLDGRIDQAFEGAAMAMAMAAPSMPYDKNYAVSINWGGFEGVNAFAGTAQARISENFVVHGGIGYGASSGTVGGRAGLTFAW